MPIVIDKQTQFETSVANLFGFTNLMQRGFTEQMLIESFDSTVYLSGTIGIKRLNNHFDIILIATKDSEVNHIETISLKMIKQMIKEYFSAGNKITFCTNLPIDIHSSKAKELKTHYNFHIKRIGFSFCEKHHLEYCEMY